eukprot:1157481-Pelagomonas_calceolata.AAC.2
MVNVVKTEREGKWLKLSTPSLRLFTPFLLEWHFLGYKDSNRITQRGAVDDWEWRFGGEKVHAAAN